MAEEKICNRCKKNKATLTYADSVLGWTHGFTEEICQECYDKEMRGNTWYKKGRQDKAREIKEAIQKCQIYTAGALALIEKKELLKDLEEDYFKEGGAYDYAERKLMDEFKGEKT